MRPILYIIHISSGLSLLLRWAMGPSSVCTYLPGWSSIDILKMCSHISHWGVLAVQHPLVGRGHKKLQRSKPRVTSVMWGRDGTQVCAWARPGGGQTSCPHWYGETQAKNHKSRNCDFGYELPSVPAQHTASTLILILQAQILLEDLPLATGSYLFEGLGTTSFCERIPKGSSIHRSFENYWHLQVLKKYTLQGVQSSYSIPKYQCQMLRYCYLNRDKYLGLQSDSDENSY